MVLSFLNVVVHIAALAVFALLLVVVGASTLRRTRLPVPPALLLPVAWAVGAWVVATSFLVAGLFGLLRLPILAGLAAALGVLALRGLRHRSRLAYDLGTAALVALPALLLLPYATASPFFYDALVYHLGLPWQALADGAITARPESLFATFPPLPQLLALLPLAIGLERLPALLHLTSFIAAGIATAALARALGAPLGLCRLAGMALLLLPATEAAAPLPAAEGWALTPIVAALAVVLGGRDHAATALLAGLLAGTAAAARLQGLPWMGIVLLVLAARSRHPLKQTALGMSAAILGALPWWLKNAVLLGSPLAPIGWRREGIETLWRDGSSPLYLGSGAGAAATAALGALGPHLVYLLPLLLIAILALTRVRQRGPWLAALAVVLGAVSWAATGSLARFLGPTLAVLLALVASAGRVAPGRATAAAGLSLALGLGLFAVPSLFGPGSLALVAATEPAAVRETLVVSNPFPAFAAAHTLPESARVLFIGEPRGFGFPRRFVAPSQHDVSPLRLPIEQLATPSEVCDWLARRGYTHVLVNRRELSRLAPTYPIAPWRSAGGLARFEQLLALLSPPVVAVDGIEIYPVKPPVP